MALPFYFIAGMLSDDTFCLYHLHTLPFYFSTISTQDNPTSHLVIMEKQVNHKLPCLDIFIDNNPNFRLTC